MELTQDLQKINPILDPELEAMLKAGVHLGHAKSKNHPAMKPYIYGVRNNVSLIDLTRTKEKLTEAMDFIKSVILRGDLVLIVGTRPSAKKAVEEMADAIDMPYIDERWIGGTLTNFNVISQRVSYLETLEGEKSSGGFDKYTKKERILKERELASLQKTFSGLRRLKRLPGAVIIVDISQDDTALREARRKNIPIVALVDTNTNASLVDWPIPANDDALPAVRYMLSRVKEAMLEAQAEAKEKKEKPSSSDKASTDQLGGKEIKKEA